MLVHERERQHPSLPRGAPLKQLASDGHDQHHLRNKLQPTRKRPQQFLQPLEQHFILNQDPMGPDLLESEKNIFRRSIHEHCVLGVRDQARGDHSNQSRDFVCRNRFP